MTYSQWGDIYCWYCPTCEEVVQDLDNFNCCPGCGIPADILEDAVYNPESDTLVERGSDRP